MENLPTTTIGLIAFIAGGAGWLVLHINKQNTEQIDETIKQFMSYVETKNGHNERISKEFSETVKGFNSALTELTAEVAKTNQREPRH